MLMFSCVCILIWFFYVAIRDRIQRFLLFCFVWEMHINLFFQCKFTHIRSRTLFFFLLYLFYFIKFQFIWTAREFFFTYALWTFRMHIRRATKIDSHTEKVWCWISVCVTGTELFFSLLVGAVCTNHWFSPYYFRLAINSLSVVCFLLFFLHHNFHVNFIGCIGNTKYNTTIKKKQQHDKRTWVNVKWVKMQTICQAIVTKCEFT